MSCGDIHCCALPQRALTAPETLGRDAPSSHGSTDCSSIAATVRHGHSAAAAQSAAAQQRAQRDHSVAHHVGDDEHAKEREQRHDGGVVGAHLGRGRGGGECFSNRVGLNV